MTIEDFERAPRYIGRVFRDVAIGPSPQWLRSRLYLAEMRSISNVVDVTNYVMHVYGNPLHAFDRTKLAGGRIVVRRARSGEELRTLDGTLRALTTEDLVIADAERPVALAAIMGGEESEVSEATTELLLEAANFEPIGILRTSERLALRTAGSNRWEKGVDPHLAEPAAKLASRLIVDLAGARMTGATDVHAGLPEPPVVRLRPDRARYRHRPRGGRRRAARDPRGLRVRGRGRLGGHGAHVARTRRDEGDRPRRGGRARRPRPRSAHAAPAQARPRPAVEGAAASPSASRTSWSVPGCPRRTPGASRQPIPTRTRSGFPIR